MDFPLGVVRDVCEDVHGDADPAVPPDAHDERGRCTRYPWPAPKYARTGLLATAAPTTPNVPDRGALDRSRGASEPWLALSASLRPCPVVSLGGVRIGDEAKVVQEGTVVGSAAQEVADESCRVDAAATFEDGAAVEPAELRVQRSRGLEPGVHVVGQYA